MDLNQIVALQTEFDRRHVGAEPFFIPISSDNPKDLEHLIVCMLGELGEYANVLKKVVRGDLSYMAATPLLNEELTDVFIYLIKVAAQTGLDLEKSYLEKLHKNEARFLHWNQP